MPQNLSSLFLQYARLERKRSVEGLDAHEAARLAELERTVSSALLPRVPRGAERRTSIRVPAELTCRWAPVPRAEDGCITMLSRAGAFVRTASPAPVGEEISLAIELPAGGQIEVPGSVANQILAPDPERRGMGVRFGRLAPEARVALDALYELSIVRQYGPPEEPA
jgi:hypothetical protein